MKRAGVLAALGTKERPGVEGGVACPTKHPFQEPGQQLTHLLPAFTLYVPGPQVLGKDAQGGVGWGTLTLGAVEAEGRTWYSVQMTEPLKGTQEA